MSFGKRARVTDSRSGSDAAADEANKTVIEAIVDGWRSLPTGVRQLVTFAGLVFSVGSVGLALQAQRQGILDGHAATPQQTRSLDDLAGGIWVELPVHGVPAATAQHNIALYRACAAPLRARRTRGGDVDASQDRKWVDYYHSAAFLGCLMSHEQKRLCDTAERKKLVALLDQTAALHRHHAKRFEELLKSPAGAYVDVLREVQSMPNGGPGALEGGRPQPGEFDPRLPRALRALTHDGYLTVRDFSPAPAEEFAPYIEAPQMEPCS